jgi:hypothetical protein
MDMYNQMVEIIYICIDEDLMLLASAELSH